MLLSAGRSLSLQISCAPAAAAAINHALQDVVQKHHTCSSASLALLRSFIGVHVALIRGCPAATDLQRRSALLTLLSHLDDEAQRGGSDPYSDWWTRVCKLVHEEEDAVWWCQLLGEAPNATRAHLFALQKALPQIQLLWPSRNEQRAFFDKALRGPDPIAAAEITRKFAKRREFIARGAAFSSRRAIFSFVFLLLAAADACPSEPPVPSAAKPSSAASPAAALQSSKRLKRESTSTNLAMRHSLDSTASLAGLRPLRHQASSVPAPAVRSAPCPASSSRGRSLRRQAPTSPAAAQEGDDDGDPQPPQASSLQVTSTRSARVGRQRSTAASPPPESAPAPAVASCPGSETLELAPLSSMLTLHPTVIDAVSDSQRACLVIRPSPRDLLCWHRCINPKALEPTTFDGAYAMSLGCINDNASWRQLSTQTEAPWAAALQSTTYSQVVAQCSPPSGVYEGPAVSHEQLQSVLEKDWLQRAKPGQGEFTVPAHLRNRVYSKDLSSALEFGPVDFFVPWDRQLRLLSTEGHQPSHDIVSSASASRAASPTTMDESDDSSSAHRTERASSDVPAFSVLQPPAIPSYSDSPRTMSDAPDESQSLAQLQLRLTNSEMAHQRLSEMYRSAETRATPIAAQTISSLSDFHNFRNRLRLQRAYCQTQLNKRDFLYHPLYLNEMQIHRESLSCLFNGYFDGVDTYYVYLKYGFQFFNMHFEQLLFPFTHQQISGRSIWYIVPYCELPKLYKVAATMLRTRLKASHTLTESQIDDFARVLLYTKQLFPPLTLLQQHGVRYEVKELRANETITAHGGSVHFGFNTEAGETLAFAINHVTQEWLRDGPQFLVDFFTWAQRLQAVPRLAGLLASCSLSLQQLKEAFNLCPHFITCNFVRGLVADLHDLLDGNKNSVCLQLNEHLTTETCRESLTHLSSAFKLIHETRQIFLTCEQAGINKKQRRLMDTSQLCACDASFQADFLRTFPARV